MNTQGQNNNMAKGHYDTNLEDNIPMYDKQAYFRDISLCTYDSNKLISGNVIKHYRCKFIESLDINAKNKNEKQSHSK